MRTEGTDTLRAVSLQYFPTFHESTAGLHEIVDNDNVLALAVRVSVTTFGLFRFICRHCHVNRMK